LRIIKEVKEYLEPDFFCQLVYDIRDIAMKYAKDLIDDSSLRKVNKKEIGSFISHVEWLLNNVVFDQNRNSSQRKLNEEVYQYTEMMELEFALKCMKMPILEKKFIGHAILVEKINQVNKKQIQQENERAQKNGNSENRNASSGQNHISTIYQLRQRWLTKDILINWMDKNQIFNMMFGESFHPEVIK